jgi:hypothetical protein
MSEDLSLDNIRMKFRETGWEKCGLDSSESRQGAAVACCEHGNEPSSSIKDRESLN